jgi:hypothetical protein
MKNIFKQIIKICERNSDDPTLKEIKTKALNRVIQYEWEEKYGIKLNDHYRLAEFNYFKIDTYESLVYLKNGYISEKEEVIKYISFEKNGKQPVNEWVYEISFPTGPYIFGNDYYGQLKLFNDFFEELKTYKPDYENHNTLYWKLENAKEIMDKFKSILKKYYDLNEKELKKRKIAKLRSELEKLEKGS